MKENARRNPANSTMNASGVVVKAGEDAEKKRILSLVVPEKDRIAHESNLIYMGCFINSVSQRVEFD